MSNLLDAPHARVDLTRAIAGHYRSLALCSPSRAEQVLRSEQRQSPALAQLWKSPMAFSLNSEQTAQLEQIIARYPSKQAACIPALHLCQRANGNWISEEVIQFVADRLQLSTAHVSGVVSFYSLLNEKQPGKHQIWVCRTLSCALRGSEAILKHCESRLGIKAGETTPDGQWTLRTAECLASCGSAPMLQLDDKYYENLTIEQLDALLDSQHDESKRVP
jgi:NADH-quinone oxidoreductase subunit E